MANYKKMYSILCGAVSEAIDATPERAKELLQEALFEAEDIYIQTCRYGQRQGDKDAHF